MSGQSKPFFPVSEAERHIEAMLAPARAAGVLARNRFCGELRTTGKDYGDIVTDVDLACEEILIDGIRAHDASHTIHSEEAGLLEGRSDWSWIVDPLDGTHNYVSGLPLFGMIVTLCHHAEPVAAILHDAYQDETVYGTLSGPVLRNGEALPPIRADKPLRRATIGWTQGYAVQQDPIARGVRNAVEANAKRLIATWSPVIETIKVLTGNFGGIVSFDGEFTDLTAARALIPALGGKVVRFSRQGEDRRFIVGCSDYVDELFMHVKKVMPE
jgi:myo-inositol-1(or 4)-monophosphatase